MLLNEIVEYHARQQKAYFTIWQHRWKGARILRYEYSVGGLKTDDFISGRISQISLAPYSVSTSRFRKLNGKDVTLSKVSGKLKPLRILKLKAKEH